MRLAMKIYNPRQTSIPIVFAPPRARAKVGRPAEFNHAALKMTAKGVTNSMASGMRRRFFGTATTVLSNKPSQGASTNQPNAIGTNAAAMRGRKEVPVSPCVAKPTIVRMASVRRSPRMRMGFFMEIVGAG